MSVCYVASDIVHNAEYHVRVVSLLITSNIWSEPALQMDMTPPRNYFLVFMCIHVGHDVRREA